MQQMAQESATCDSVAKWMSNCSDNGLGPAKAVCSVVQFLLAECVSPSEVHCQLIQLSSDE